MWPGHRCLHWAGSTAVCCDLGCQQRRTRRHSISRHCSDPARQVETGQRLQNETTHSCATPHQHLGVWCFAQQSRANCTLSGHGQHALASASAATQEQPRARPVCTLYAVLTTSSLYRRLTMTQGGLPMVSTPRLLPPVAHASAHEEKMNPVSRHTTAALACQQSINRSTGHASRPTPLVVASGANQVIQIRSE
eukprot:329107-Chlamydomonas_euryale.AAC.2